MHHRIFNKKKNSFTLPDARDEVGRDAELSALRRLRQRRAEQLGRRGRGARGTARARVLLLVRLPSLLTAHPPTQNLTAIRRQLRFERDAALREVAALKQQTVELEARLAASATACAALETNISSLYLTAKAEIARKDRVIAELRAIG